MAAAKITQQHLALIPGELFEVFSSVLLQEGAGLKIEQLLRMMSDEEKPPAPPLRNTSNQGHNKVRNSSLNFFKTQRILL